MGPLQKKARAIGLLPSVMDIEARRRGLGDIEAKLDGLHDNVAVLVRVIEGLRSVVIDIAVEVDKLSAAKAIGEHEAPAD
jgi:hypothetical protein